VIGDVENRLPLEFVRPLWPVVLFVGVLRQLVIGDRTVREALVRRPFWLPPEFAAAEPHLAAAPLLGIEEAVKADSDLEPTSLL
jgi:hypothetical protein